MTPLTPEHLAAIRYRAEHHWPASAADVPALLAEIDRLAAELDEAKNLLADLVIKATGYGVQDGDFVANYILPTGPLHRAMPWLEQRGIVVRPGFDGRVPVESEPCPDHGKAVTQ